MNIYLTVSNDIDLKSLLKLNHFSDNLITKIFNNLSLVIVNNDPFIDYHLKKSDKLIINLPDERSEINEIDEQINIIYEDDYILIINKPSNLACIGTIKHYHRHLSGMVLNYYRKINLKSTIHFVNRLDYHTNGLVLIAKHQYIHGLLAKTKIEKKYLLTCAGKLNDQGIIDLSIKKDNNKMKRIIDNQGLRAITEYQLLSYDGNNSTALAILHTGRTHQIRLHFASIGHPIIGDSIYGMGSGVLQLKSKYLSFIHPITLKHMKFDI